MSRLDDLPPDQRATLSLLLRRGKTYAEVAEMLEIPERSVHDRAHAALAVLAAREARELTPSEREEVGDYLLGQRSAIAERLATRTYLEGSPQARAWAGALADELEPLAGSALPEIPNGVGPGTATAVRAPSVPASEAQPTRSPESGALDDSPPSTRPSAPRGSTSPSRRGGVLLLALIVAGVIVAIVLLTSGGGSHSASNSSEAGGGSSSTASTETQKAQAKEDKRITLTPPDASSRAVGVAEVLSEGSQYAFYLAAQHLPPSKGKGFFYAIWLYNSPSSYEALSRAPDVGPNGNVQGGALLPKDAAKYNTMLITRETAPKPSKPGPVVLRGAFALH
ncbi:MAG TPA: sigma factor-like helix-turn-helix DNA-binding protein [Solirubrobacteraceae bacterium]|nr:sigma factor-like helix-turn-helix DNA-binding protein [Solirubrobacteraceae bacterium]